MKKFSLFFILLFVCVTVMAVPANRKPKVVKQSDGTSLTVILNGDESLRFYTTLDGNFLVKESNGDFSYAVLSEDGKIVSTNCLAHNKGERSGDEQKLLSTINIEDIKNGISKSHAKRSATFRSAAKRSGSSIKPLGEVLVPVLLVEYKDVKFTYTKEDIDKLLNEEGYKYENILSETYGSARDYFIAQSGDKFKPKFVVTDIITLSQNMSYYGANNADEQDGKPAQMIKEAIEKADPNVDFSEFDNDGNGEVEFVYCIYAGYAEANGANENTIWPHQWEISSGTGSSVKVDGKKCNVYACSSELNVNEEYESEIGKIMSGIGTICHEFSHCLGLYDVYDVTGESGNWCMNEWDLMDYGNHVNGGYIPVGYNSYQKDVCGWKELEVLTEKGIYSMTPQTQNGVGYKIVNEANSNEYFILENRKKEGWDQNLPAEGMMIIHVDYDYSAWANNEINVTKGHPRFQIVPADNDLPLYGDPTVTEDRYNESLKGDLWPGKVGNTQFTNTSLPAAKVFTGGYLNKPVTNIKYENYVASFKFMGDILDTPELKAASDITSNSFVANWNSVEGAVEYDVELYRTIDAGDGNGDVIDLLAEDFIHCNKSNILITESNIATYIPTTGWEGDNIYSENGVVRIGAASSAGLLYTPYLSANGNVTIKFDTHLYISNDTGVCLYVVVVDAEENEIVSKSVVPTSKITTVELEAPVSGEFYVEFDTYASTGKKRANIDNVVVSAVETSKTEFVMSVTTSNTSYEFNNLAVGNYKYRVKARGTDEEESAYTEYEEVIIDNKTAIESVGEENGDAVVYTLSGIKVGNAVNGELPRLPRGVYIVKGKNCTRKIFVK